MKLLFDQNISYRIIKILSSYFPGSNQVKALGLENKTDREIWNFAKSNNYSIVTFDADFYDLSNLYGHPPKIIWLRSGNTKTQHIADLFIAQKPSIISFLEENDKWSCLEID